MTLLSRISGNLKELSTNNSVDDFDYLCLSEIKLLQIDSAVSKTVSSIVDAALDTEPEKLLSLQKILLYFICGLESDAKLFLVIIKIAQNNKNFTVLNHVCTTQQFSVS